MLPSSHIEAIGPDMSEKDNASLALAVSRVYPAFSEIFDRDGIDENEFLRIVYRMAGEVQPQTDRHPTKVPGSWWESSERDASECLPESTEWSPIPLRGSLPM